MSYKLVELYWTNSLIIESKPWVDTTCASDESDVTGLTEPEIEIELRGELTEEEEVAIWVS